MAERSGVDLIIRGKDETAEMFSAAGRRIDKLAADAAKLGAGDKGVGSKIGNAIGNQILGGMATAMGGRAIDQLFRTINTAQAGAKLGGDFATEFYSGFAATLEDIPVAGAIGKFLAVNVFDPLMGGDMAREAARKAMMAAGEGAIKAQQSISEMIAEMDAKALTEKQQRRLAFEKQLAPKLNAIIDGGGHLSDMVVARAQAEGAFAREENRIKERIELTRQLAEEDARRAEEDRIAADQKRESERAAETAARDAAKAESERMSIAERALERTKRLREENAEADMRLAGAQEAGSVNIEAIRFRQQRAAVAAQASPADKQAREQQITNKVLDDMLVEQREQTEALRRIAESRQVFEISAL